MALAYAIRGRGSIGDLAVRVVDITLDNAYPAGGWAISPQGVGLGLQGVVLGVIPMGTEQGRLLEFDQANGKLQVRDGSGAANAANPEITTATQMDTMVARVMVVGQGSG
jgi:hypothetical protein